MNIVQLMVTIIIVTILVTVILGVVSYIAYWLRRSRRPIGIEEAEPEFRFFYRYIPAAEEAEPGAIGEDAGHLQAAHGGTPVGLDRDAVIVPS